MKAQLFVFQSEHSGMLGMVFDSYYWLEGGKGQ